MIAGLATPAVAQPDAYVFVPNSRALVGNRNGDTVSVIDLATNTVIGTLPVIGSPGNLVMTPNGQKAYVSLETANQVGVIDLGTNTVTQTLAVGPSPTGLDISPDGARVFVANFGGSSVSEIDVATDTVLSTFDIGHQAIGIAFTPAGSALYVSGYAHDVVTVVDPGTHAVIATIPNAGTPAMLRMGANLITSTATAASDASLTAQGFRNYINFLGGTLTLTGNLTRRARCRCCRTTPRC